jgi:phospholipid/cholesterol/gamma-HCH transport system permease protein
MAGTKLQSAENFQAVQNADDSLSLFLSGELTIEICADLLDQLPRTLEHYQFPKNITFDLAQVTQADDYGVLVVQEIRALAEKNNSQLTLVNVTENVKKVFTLFEDTAPPLSQSAASQPMRPARFISGIGKTALLGAKNLDSSLSFLGGVVFALASVLRHPLSFRLNDVIELIKKSGVNAIPIVGLVGLIIGLILAFIASIQLEQFGGHIFIPAMITFAMVAEVGPIMAAIVIAGRTGSAYAAEIGSMKISEEIDALSSMGFSPIVFLVIPRIAALLVALPILTIFAVIAAIFGGFLVCVTMLGLMPGPFLQGVTDALFLQDILWGMAKSGIFAILIATVGCLRGFQVQGGAASVGNAATSAVVSSIFLTILTDSVCAVIRIYWG